MFEQQGFGDLDGLADVTENDLISMGIDKVGDRRKILTHCAQLKQ